MKNVLIIPDCHIPFHDERAYELMLKVAQMQPIHEVVILGDFVDFYGVSSHAKDPRILTRIEEEIELAVTELSHIRALWPKAKITYIQGNHAYRLERYLQNKAPDLFGIVDFPELMEFDELDINYVPYGPSQLYCIAGSKLYARHEPLAGGVHCTHGTVVKAGCSVVFGHTHRLTTSSVVMANGEPHIGINAGWLGDAKNPVFNYVKSFHQWSLGFVMAYVLPNRNFYVDLKQIIDYKCHHQGKIVHG